MTDYSKNAWKYYEYGRAYNNSLTPNQYRLVETNTEFFAGNQWINMPDNEAMRRLSKPTFNIIKRITSMFVASLTSNGTTINFEPLAGRADGEEGEAAAFATAEVRNLLEKFKMDFRIRDALFDGAVTGDYCAHFFWNPEAKPYGGAFGAYRGEIEMELVDGINVMFGNPNSANVEKQPYIIIAGRDTVENLKAEAMYWEQEPAIVPDTGRNAFNGSGFHTELRGDDDKSSKATYVYLYTKQRRLAPVLDEAGQPVIDPLTGRVKQEEVITVHVTKATETCTIFEDIDTGLSRYPIAWGNWQKQKNRYHGRALVTEVIPNQIFINQMMAMIFRHLQTQAFPTKLYNADLLPGISNEVGTAIGVRNLLPGQDPGTAISTIPAADMSNQIIRAIELCMQYTKECLGATDAQLGNLQANNTSAIMVLQNASEVPLENTRAGLNEWMEDIGAILLDMMGTYYGIRPVQRTIELREPVYGTVEQETGTADSTGSAGSAGADRSAGPAGAAQTNFAADMARQPAAAETRKPLIDPMTGQPAVRKVKKTVLQDYDFRKFRSLWFNISVDAGATTYYSEIAMVQTLDNLRKDGALDIIDYLERIPDKLIGGKQELIEKLKRREGLADNNGG